MRWGRRIIRAAAITAIGLSAIAAYILYPPVRVSIAFPDGKRFAFTIVDDTDLVALERVRPLYDALHRHGLRTTKTVWVLESRDVQHAPNRGDSLVDPDYREFILQLRDRGFEIALHGVRGGSSERADIVRGLDAFRDIVGSDPTLHVNHSLNRDNVYWGENRWSFPLYRWLYSAAFGGDFSGEDSGSPHYWGDLVKDRILYVNQFTFADINLLNVTPAFPYHLPDKPYVNYWFPTANGDNLDTFEALLSTENLNRLEREGGISLVYTHLGAGSFNQDGGVRFEARLHDLAARDGWFAPASEILDYLREQPGWRAQPTWRERIRLETLFIWELLTH